MRVPAPEKWAPALSFILQVNRIVVFAPRNGCVRGVEGLAIMAVVSVAVAHRFAWMLFGAVARK